ncbi:hypothetical protein Q7P37_000159 [Cladosporium fusiforme]
MLAFIWHPRHRRAIVYTIIVCTILGAWSIFKHGLSRNHYLSAELARLSPEFEGGRHFLSASEAVSVCRAHDFAIETTQQNERKVYDLVLISTELDWLEIRLHTLARYVDYFVIVESATTFTGKPKPLYLKDNWETFREFHHKIIYRVVDDPVQSQRIWDHEDYFRNSMLKSVFPGLTGTAQQANPGDVLIVSDMDEIIRPGTILLLRHCRIPARLTLRTQFYYYSFQWQHRGQQWPHPDVMVFQGSETLSPNDLRQGLLGAGWAPIASLRRWWDRGTLWNAGWHCSSCFSTVAEMRTKMHSFSHQGWNTAKNRELDTMIDRVRHGKDLFDRAGEHYDRIENNKDVPSYILAQFEQHGKFRHLIDRDGVDAGFNDFYTVSRDEV